MRCNMFSKTKPKLLLGVLCLLLASMPAFSQGKQAEQGPQEQMNDMREKTENGVSSAGPSEKEVFAEIIDSYDRKVVIEEKPQRIISLGPNITETIFALGQGDKLAGRTDYCDYPAEVSNIPSVGSIMDPSLESIIELNPDLILSSAHVGKEVINALEKSGLTIAALYADKNLEGAYTIISETGRLLGAEEEASRIVNDMKDLIQDIQNRIDGLEKPDVYYVVDFGEWGDFTAGGNTFIHQLITLAGGNNVAEDIQGWSYSIEKIIEDNPDILICSKYFDTKERLVQTSGYEELPAIKNGNVHEIDNNKLDRQGPRNASAVLDLAKIFHPEAFQ